MSPGGERRLLQAAVALVVLVPLATAAISIARGPAWLHAPAGLADLDSHFRYLSGIFLAMALGFVSCLPRIEAKGARLRLLGALVVAGGLARLWSLAAVGAPSAGHLAGLAIELGVVPLILWWQARVAARYRTPSSPGPASTVGA